MYKKIWLVLILMMYFTNSFSIEITTGDTKKMDEKIQELVIEDTKIGEGRESEKGLSISVHYTGWILDASKSDKKVISLTALLIGNSLSFSFLELAK